MRVPSFRLTSKVQGRHHIAFYRGFVCILDVRSYHLTITVLTPKLTCHASSGMSLPRFVWFYELRKVYLLTQLVPSSLSLYDRIALSDSDTCAVDTDPMTLPSRMTSALILALCVGCCPWACVAALTGMALCF